MELALAPHTILCLMWSGCIANSKNKRRYPSYGGNFVALSTGEERKGGREKGLYGYVGICDCLIILLMESTMWKKCYIRIYGRRAIPCCK